MTSFTARTPSHHTPDGGVVVGNESASRRLVLFEDPQCPYCRQFEEISGEALRGRVAAEAISVEYRMRCFLGVESVRADNALALAAELGHFDELRQALFAAQPPEGTGGFTVADLIDLGRTVGLHGPDYATGVREGRFEPWVVEREEGFQEQDPQGTPAAWLDHQAVDPRSLFNPAALEALLRA